MAGNLRKAFWISFAGAAALCAIASQAYAAKGDWPMLNFDAQGTRNNPYESVLNKQTVKSLQLIWKAKIENYGITGQKYEHLNTVSSPAVADGTLYVAGSHRFYAIDAVSGTPIWSVALVAPNWSSPAVANGIVYIATHSGTLYALDTATGKTLWSSKLGTTKPGSPTVSGGQVFIEDYSGDTYAFNARSGKLLWETVEPDDQAMYGAPVVTNGIVIFPDLLNIHAYDVRTGLEIWECPYGSAYVVGSLTTDGQNVYVFGKLITALDAKSGVPMWESVLPYENFGGGGVALEKSHLYVFYQAENYSIFDTRSGDVQTIEPESFTEYTYSPTLANHVLYANNNRGIVASDPKSGKQLWTASIDVAISSPVVSNGMVYVVGGDGSLYAYGLKK